MLNFKRAKRKSRQTRIRKKIVGTKSVPRLNIYRSLSNIYAQIIDDEKQKTLFPSPPCPRRLRTRKRN